MKMKLRYFIRGLGLGIIFGTLIMLVAHLKSDDNNITDKEIEEKAVKLGMVWPDEATATDAGEEDVSDMVTDEVAKATTEVITTEMATTEATTTEKKTTEATTEKKTTEKEKKTTEKNTYTEATITVTGGMGSNQVAELLEEAGIVDNAEAFDNYLNSQGISNKIQVSTFKFNSGMTYEDIASKLTTPVDN